MGLLRNRAGAAAWFSSSLKAGSSQVVPASDHEFGIMRAQVRFFRSRLEQLDLDSRAAIEVNVSDRIHWRDTVPLPPERRELADEIFAVLGDTALSLHQASQLEREFFGV